MNPDTSQDVAPLIIEILEPSPHFTGAVPLPMSQHWLEATLLPTLEVAQVR